MAKRNIKLQSLSTLAKNALRDALNSHNPDPSLITTLTYTTLQLTDRGL